MGTTLVCVCMDGNRAVVGNVGDSRAYLLRNGTCQQITLDHSLIDEEIRSGKSDYPSARVAPASGKLTWLLGF